MAIVNMNWMESLRGRISGLVFYKRCGQTYVRKPPVQEGKPSSLQLLQRKRLEEVTAFYLVIRQSGLHGIWKKAAADLPFTGMNLFVKENIGAFSGIDRIRDYERLHFSWGNLPEGDCMEVACREDGRTIVVRWDTQRPLSKKRGNDRFMAVVVFENEEFAAFFPSNPFYRRSDGQAEIVLAAGSPRPMYVYCFFGAADGKAYSKDVCCKL